jgi:hypothetical protein
MKQRASGWMMALALVLAAGGARAATYEIGVKGGIAIQTLSGDDVESDEIESRTGFAGGGYFQADFNRNFGIRFEALYFMKGATADSASFDAAFKLDYLEMPVLLVGHIPVSETARLSVFAGPTLALNVNAEIEGSAGGVSASVDVGDYITDFDFGLTFGAGMYFDLGSAILGVDGRYGFGLATIDDDDSEQADVKNQGFAFLVSIGVPLGSR